MKTLILFCLVGVCFAATIQKPDLKEKRDDDAFPNSKLSPNLNEKQTHVPKAKRRIGKMLRELDLAGKETRNIDKNNEQTERVRGEANGKKDVKRTDYSYYYPEYYPEVYYTYPEIYWDNYYYAYHYNPSYYGYNDLENYTYEYNYNYGDYNYNYDGYGSYSGCYSSYLDGYYAGYDDGFVEGNISGFDTGYRKGFYDADSFDYWNLFKRETGNPSASSQKQVKRFDSLKEKRHHTVENEANIKETDKGQGN